MRKVHKLVLRIDIINALSKNSINHTACLRCKLRCKLLQELWGAMLVLGLCFERDGVADEFVCL